MIEKGGVVVGAATPLFLFFAGERVGFVWEKLLNRKKVLNFEKNVLQQKILTNLNIQDEKQKIANGYDWRR